MLEPNDAALKFSRARAREPFLVWPPLQDARRIPAGQLGEPEHVDEYQRPGFVLRPTHDGNLVVLIANEK